MYNSNIAGSLSTLSTKFFLQAVQPAFKGGNSNRTVCA
jgi:hypothetical protein